MCVACASERRSAKPHWAAEAPSAYTKIVPDEAQMVRFSSACSIPAAVQGSRKVRRHVTLKHQSGRDLRRVDSQNPSSGGAFGGENEASE
eukprot:4459611-Prymnesium_polylepis.1